MRCAASMLGLLLTTVLFTGCPEAGVGGDAVVGDTSYLLSVEILGQGTVTVSPEKSAYSAGETVTLNSVSQAESLFAGWDGTVESDTNPLVVLIDGDYTLRARFTHKTDDDDGNGIPAYLDPTE